MCFIKIVSIEWLHRVLSREEDWFGSHARVGQYFLSRGQVQDGPGRRTTNRVGIFGNLFTRDVFRKS